MTDEEAIRRTLAQFCTALDDRRFEEWSELFTETGVFETRSATTTGRTAIRAGIERGELAVRPELRRMHTTHNEIIDVDGDNATVSCYLVQFDQEPGGPVTVKLARYADQLVRTPAGWRFARRTIVY